MGREMRTNKQWWLKDIRIIGFDGTGAEGTPPATPPGTPPASGEGDGGAGAGEPKGEPEKTYTAAEIAGLKSALEKERSDRKAHEKELATFRKAKQDKEDSEKSEVDRLTAQQQRASDQLQKLSKGYRDGAVERAIIAAAAAAQFRDPTDALRAHVISAIGVEQNEDDPTQITIDQATVNEAIKALAKAKPHYLSVPGGQGTATKSGSSFGGSARGTDADAERTQLMNQYPALRGRR